MEITTDRLVTTYIKIRDCKSAESKVWEEREAKLNTDLKTIEMELLRRAQAEGVTGFKIAGIGTAYQKESIKVTIADDLVFYAFVKELGDLDFFERRVKSTHVQEYMKANGGHLPPGINVFKEIGMGIRRGDK